MNGIPKKEMNEAEIRANFISPAIEAKWKKNQIRLEEQITDGQFNLHGNLYMRGAKKIADYVLYLSPNNPIAVVEAKSNKYSISHGLQQAMIYAEMLGVPFAYSSNGDGFKEHDLLNRKEREFGLGEFPSPDELFSRYQQYITNGEGFNKDQKKVINTPYYSSQNTHSPRYYQRVAINRTVEAIARNQKRILLVMATGTGKTYTAFQIVWRLRQAGIKRKILYLADRNVLVDQTIQQDFAPLQKVIHKINVAKDNKNTLAAYEIYFSLYQQLVGEDGKEHFRDLFKPEFFDLIIVDECHRGSAKEASQWRKILEYFSEATQIGMTATPKETKDVSNISYFGDPIYTYSLKQGIEDGFLAPFKVIGIKTNIGEGWRPSKGQLDFYGNPIEDRIYTNSDYDYNIVILDRINAVAREITEYLKDTDQEAKTIVFCPTEDAAERMRSALVNLNSEMVKEHPDYIVRITGSDKYGQGFLDYFLSTSIKYPVIATTSQLLSTGVDCKMVKLIVLDKMIHSMTEFKQIIGRGTRLLEQQGKTHFVVMDFRGVSRMFADPDWDGPIEIDPNFKPGRHHGKRIPTSEPPEQPEQIPIVTPDGCTVHIINKTVAIYDTDGKLLKQESLTDYTKTNILGEYASLDNFIRKWTSADKKKVITEALKERGIDLASMKAEQNMEDVDDFDFICHIAYDVKPLTRKERASKVNRNFLNKYSGTAREILEALLDKYMNEGIYEIESSAILRINPFKKFGTEAKIAEYFGGDENYRRAFRELEEEIYKAG